MCAYREQRPPVPNEGDYGDPYQEGYGPPGRRDYVEGYGQTPGRRDYQEEYGEPYDEQKGEQFDRFGRPPPPRPPPPGYERYPRDPDGHLRPRPLLHNLDHPRTREPEHLQSDRPLSKHLDYPAGHEEYDRPLLKRGHPEFPPEYDEYDRPLPKRSHPYPDYPPEHAEYGRPPLKRSLLDDRPFLQRGLLDDRPPLKRGLLDDSPPLKRGLLDYLPEDAHLPPGRHLGDRDPLYPEQDRLPPDRPLYQIRQRPPGSPIDREDPARYNPDPTLRDPYTDESEDRKRDQREWGPSGNGHLLETPTEGAYFEPRQDKAPLSVQDKKQDKSSKPVSLLDLPFGDNKSTLRGAPPPKESKPLLGAVPNKVSVVPNKDSKPPSLLELDIKPVPSKQPVDDAIHESQRRPDLGEDCGDPQFRDLAFNRQRNAEFGEDHGNAQFRDSTVRFAHEESQDKRRQSAEEDMLYHERKYDDLPGERRYEGPADDRRYEGPPDERRYQGPPESKMYGPGKQVWRSEPEKRFYHQDGRSDKIFREGPRRENTVPDYNKFHQRPEQFGSERDNENEELFEDVGRCRENSVLDYDKFQQRQEHFDSEDYGEREDILVDVGHRRENTAPDYKKLQQRPDEFGSEHDGEKEEMLRDVGHRDKRLMASRPDNTAYMYKLLDESKQTNRTQISEASTSQTVLGAPTTRQHQTFSQESSADTSQSLVATSVHSSLGTHGTDLTQGFTTTDPMMKSIATAPWNKTSTSQVPWTKTSTSQNYKNKPVIDQAKGTQAAVMTALSQASQVHGLLPMVGLKVPSPVPALSVPPPVYAPIPLPVPPPVPAPVPPPVPSPIPLPVPPPVPVPQPVPPPVSVPSSVAPPWQAFVAPPPIPAPVPAPYSMTSAFGVRPTAPPMCFPPLPPVAPPTGIPPLPPVATPISIPSIAPPVNVPPAVSAKSSLPATSVPFAISYPTVYSRVPTSGDALAGFTQSSSTIAVASKTKELTSVQKAWIKQHMPREKTKEIRDLNKPVKPPPLLGLKIDSNSVAKHLLEEKQKSSRKESRRKPDSRKKEHRRDTETSMNLTPYVTEGLTQPVVRISMTGNLQPYVPEGLSQTEAVAQLVVSELVDPAGNLSDQATAQQSFVGDEAIDPTGGGGAYPGNWQQVNQTTAPPTAQQTPSGERLRNPTNIKPAAGKLKPYVPKRLRATETAPPTAQQGLLDTPTLPSLLDMPGMNTNDVTKIDPMYKQPPRIVNGYSKELPRAYRFPQTKKYEMPKHSGPVTHLRWCTPRYSHLLMSVSMDNTIKIWDCFKEKLPKAKLVNFHEGAVKDAIWGFDGLQVVSCGFDKTARLVDIPSCKELRIYDHPSFVTCVKFHPEIPQMFITGTYNSGVACWDTRTHSVVRKYEAEGIGQILDVQFLPGGTEFLSSCDAVSRDSANRTIMAWDFGSSAVLSNQIYQELYTCPTLKLHPGMSEFVAQSNGDYIVKFSATKPYTMNKRIRYEGHEVKGYPVGCNFTPGGEFLLSGSADGRMYIYNYNFKEFVNKRSLIKTVPCYDSALIDVAPHPFLSGIVATCSWGGDITLWE